MRYPGEAEKAFSTLPGTKGMILLLRSGLGEARGKKHTPEECAARLKLTGEDARILEREALENLRRFNPEIADNYVEERFADGLLRPRELSRVEF